MHGPLGVASIEFQLDSGVMYSLLPYKAWRKIGVKAKHKLSFPLPDGTEINRRVSECRVTLSFGECTTPVILGEPGDVPILGTLTLTSIGWRLNPFTRQVEKVEAFPLMGIA